MYFQSMFVVFSVRFVVFSVRCVVLLVRLVILKDPTRANIAQLPDAHAQLPDVHAHTLPREPLRGHMTLYDVTSVSHVGHAQWYILYYCYSKKKRGNRLHMRTR
jgi:hypothetical protein